MDDDIKIPIPRPKPPKPPKSELEKIHPLDRPWGEKIKGAYFFSYLIHVILTIAGMLTGIILLCNGGKNYYLITPGVIVLLATPVCVWIEWYFERFLFVLLYHVVGISKSLSEKGPKEEASSSTK